MVWFYGISTIVCYLMPNPFLHIQFQTIPFSISPWFSFIDVAPESPTTRSQSGPESNSKEGVFHIPQRSSITGASLLDYLVSYPLVGKVLPLCRDAVGVDWAKYY